MDRTTTHTATSLDDFLSMECLVPFEIEHDNASICDSTLGELSFRERLDSRWDITSSDHAPRRPVPDPTPLSEFLIHEGLNHLEIAQDNATSSLSCGSFASDQWNDKRWQLASPMSQRKRRPRIPERLPSSSSQRSPCSQRLANRLAKRNVAAPRMPRRFPSRSQKRNQDVSF